METRQISGGPRPRWTAVCAGEVRPTHGRPGLAEPLVSGAGCRALDPRPTVSAMYIVKNEEEFLPFSIRSIYKVVDEIIVVDGYSTDRTVEIAKSFDKTRNVLYCDSPDYSVNRNLALEAATGDWLIPMDADMVFYSDIDEVVPRLIRNPRVDVYYCWFYHLMREPNLMQNRSDYDPLYRREFFLVRRRPGLRWVGAVHERLEGTGPNVADSGLHFVHYGYVKPQREVFRRWVKYAVLEGKGENAYEGVCPDTILDDRPVRPFTRGHPEVIADYIRRRGGLA
ncbi:MAG: glycosyltransferase family 2 protein [Bacillota bacterium]|nr:glycosyltransferase family 2 protein [Bacillota bacterium]